MAISLISQLWAYRFWSSHPGPGSETGMKVVTSQGCPQVHRQEHPEEPLDEEARAPGQPQALASLRPSQPLSLEA